MILVLIDFLHLSSLSHGHCMVQPGSMEGVCWCGVLLWLLIELSLLYSFSFSPHFSLCGVCVCVCVCVCVPLFFSIIPLPSPTLFLNHPTSLSHSFSQSSHFPLPLFFSIIPLPSPTSLSHFPLLLPSPTSLSYFPLLLASLPAQIEELHMISYHSPERVASAVNARIMFYTGLIVYNVVTH